MVYGGNIGTAPIEDPEGNTYQTVSIGNQVWMKENLKKTEGLEEGTDYIAYDEDVANVEDYGYLYTQAAISNEELCPAGWRVPVSTDWEQLFVFVGGAFWYENTENVLPNLMKVSDLWTEAGVTPTNFSGFSALPGGEASNDVGGLWNFMGLTERATFWSLMNIDGNPEVVNLNGGEALIDIFQPDLIYPIAHSIRCIKEADLID